MPLQGDHRGAQGRRAGDAARDAAALEGGGAAKNELSKKNKIDTIKENKKKRQNLGK